MARRALPRDGESCPDWPVGCVVPKESAVQSGGTRTTDQGRLLKTYTWVRVMAQGNGPQLSGDDKPSIAATVRGKEEQRGPHQKTQWGNSYTTKAWVKRQGEQTPGNSNSGAISYLHKAACHCYNESCLCLPLPTSSSTWICVCPREVISTMLRREKVTRLRLPQEAIQPTVNQQRGSSGTFLPFILHWEWVWGQGVAHCT